MTWYLKDWRLYVVEAPKEWRPELLGRWQWNVMHNQGGWERQGQAESRELAFEHMLDYLERLEKNQVSETYTVTFEGEQFMITMTPFEDVGTLAARVFFAATGGNAVNLEDLLFSHAGIPVAMYAECGILWGRDVLELKRRADVPEGSPEH